jgi:hypothetical protein
VALTAPKYRELQCLARRRTASYAEVVRAKILLLAYEHPDWSNAAIARAVGCTESDGAQVAATQPGGAGAAGRASARGTTRLKPGTNS